VGSALFISTVVTFLCVRSATPDMKIQVTPILFMRDLIFQTITILYLLAIIVIIQEINIFVAVGYLIIYTIFVVVVVIQSNSKLDESDGERSKSMEAVKLINELAAMTHFKS
jgi:Ca2+/Na+ antiporter